jgi:catechol 2,3-dioxygenase-like lactoylglutathione lyase family enzyme
MRVRTLPTTSVAPYKLAHAVLRTAHLDESIAYYRALLSARVVFEQRPFGAGLTYDQEHHRIALLAVPEAVRSDLGTVSGMEVVDAQGADLAGLAFAAAPGLEHLAFTFDSLGSLLATYVRARDDHGIRPIYCINHGPTISFYFEDPDGHKTELQIDTMPMELADEYAQSAVHAANPLGWPFDPDELVARYEAGEPLAELLSIGREQVSAV